MKHLYKIIIFIAFCLISSFSFCQEETKPIQVEFSGVVFKYSDVLYSQFGIAVNLPTQRQRLYTNIALLTKQIDAAEEGGGTINRQMFTIGKNYQYTRNHFSLSIGLNTGLFYTNRLYSGITARHIGVIIVPKVEIGLNTKKYLIGIGFYIGIGGGYYHSFFNGEIYKPEPNSKNSYFKLDGTMNPYLRFVIK